MTTRLYYHDSSLCEFDAEVGAVIETPRPAIVLDRTAFYPTSGGQIFDTGWIVPESASGSKIRVTEVADSEDGRVIHFLEAPVKNLQPGTRVHGQIDPARRRDHMQQHSGQHVLSAAFVRLFNMPTVSFHMADDYCSIDLETPTLSKEQVESAERLANEIILENRLVDVRFVAREQAATLGLRKIPPVERDELRLIDTHDFDLTACGGTHVKQTGADRHCSAAQSGKSPSGVARGICRWTACGCHCPPRFHRAYGDRRAVLFTPLRRAPASSQSTR